MGTITATIEVTNNVDFAQAAGNFIPESEIRHLTIEEVMVDTGATTLCLPKKYIEQLGLPMARKVVISTPTGEFVTNMYDNARMAFKCRSTLVEVIELHDDARPLLGVIPMEMLGLEVDVVKHELRLLPDYSKDTYLMVY